MLRRDSVELFCGVFGWSHLTWENYPNEMTISGGLSGGVISQERMNRMRWLFWVSKHLTEKTVRMRWLFRVIESSHRKNCANEMTAPGILVISQKTIPQKRWQCPILTHILRPQTTINPYTPSRRSMRSKERRLFRVFWVLDHLTWENSPNEMTILGVESSHRKNCPNEMTFFVGESSHREIYPNEMTASDNYVIS